MKILNSANALERMENFFNSFKSIARSHNFEDFARDFQYEVIDWITQ
jgi:hypothetical protein